MLKTKSYKIILFVTAMLMFALAIISFSPLKSVSAVSTSDYFVTDSGTTMAFEGTSAKATVSNNGYVELKNDLSLNKLKIDTTVSVDVQKLTVTFKTASFADGEKKIDHTVIFNRGEQFSFDGVVNTDSGTFAYTEVPVDATNLPIYFDIVDGDLAVRMGDASAPAIKTPIDKKALILDKCIAEDMRFTFELANGATEKAFAINSIDQDYTNIDGDYKQTFELEGENIKTMAKPVISLSNNETLFSFNGTSYKMRAFKGTLYTIDVKAYSVLGTNPTFKGFVAESGIVISGNEAKNEVKFENVQSARPVTVKFDESSYVFNIDVVDRASDDKAPEYFDNATAIENFKTELQKATKSADGEHCIKIGDNLTVPSMKALITDDLSSYSELTHTIYYSTPKMTNTTTSWEIPVESAGRYMFYVVFKDSNGNEMKMDTFETVINDGDEGEVIPYKDGASYFSQGVNAKYVFIFDIEDDAPIKVSAISHENGFIGLEYTASSFKIDYTGYTPKYSLFYNSNADAEVGELKESDGWIEIPQGSKATVDDEFAEGFTYEDIKNIAYNGELTFTPDRAGKYAIKCTISSTSSVRADSAIAEIVVTDEPTEVKPDTKWFENNKVSVIFLGIGTLCLIGIVILLCIKPKEKIEEEIED